MRSADVWLIVVVAVSGAVLVGLVGLAVSWWTRRFSLRWQFAVLSVSAVLGVYVGVLAIAQLMLISSHDLRVTTTVTSVAAVVAIVVALLMGAAVTRWSDAVRAQVRGLGTDEPGVTVSGPREFRALSAELAETQRLLATAREHEAQLEQSRRELVSWVSHDLRTPLAGIRAMAEALEDGLAPDPDRYLRQIRAEVERTTRMVDDLFELSLINAGVLRLAPEPVALADLVSDALAGAEPLADAGRVRLDGRVHDGLEVVADPAGLGRVVANLLVNAIRHTPADGVVEVVGSAGDGVVELSVSDGCDGLSAEDRERMFDPGWQRDAARTPSSDLVGPGAGLGLAVVHGIVEAHHGTVVVENLSGRSGCRFTVSLPG